MWRSLEKKKKILMTTSSVSLVAPFRCLSRPSRARGAPRGSVPHILTACLVLERCEPPLSSPVLGLCVEEMDCSQWPRRNYFHCRCLSRALLLQSQSMPSVKSVDRGPHVTDMVIRMKQPLPSVPPPMPAPPLQSQIL